MEYPFGVIAGSGLGASYSSLKQQGDIFQHVGFGQANVKAYLNVSNGNLVVYDRLLVIDEMGGPITLGYIYNSQAKTSNKTWQFTLKKFIQLNNSNQPLILQEEDGHLTTYVKDNVNGYYHAPGLANGTPYCRYDAEKNDWIWFHPGTQVTEIYNAQGLLILKRNAQGQTITFEYDNNQLITAIQGAANRYEIRRSDRSVSLYEISKSNETRLQTYLFDSAGRLSVTETPTLNYQTRYEYESEQSSLLSSIAQSDKSKMTFMYTGTNAPDNWVTSIITDANHGRITYPTPQQSYVSIKEGPGNEIRLTLDDQQRLIALAQRTGFSDQPGQTIDTTYYSYAETGQIKTITHPDNGQTQYEYDPNFGVLLKEMQPNGQTTQHYYMMDAGAGVPYYKISTAQKLADKTLITFYVYEHDISNSFGKDNRFLRFKISPEGRVTEYRPDKNSDVASIRQYLAGKLDTSHNLPWAPISLQQMQKWVDAQDPQKISLTEYINDARGCPALTYQYTAIDKNGHGVLENRSEVLTGRNRYGDVIVKQAKRENNQQAITKYTFDELQRLTSLTDAENKQTHYQYFDDKLFQQITYPTGKIAVKQLNGNGWLLDETERVQSENLNQQRHTNYQRNAGGRTVITNLPDGRKAYTFYDEQDRLGFAISPTGVVVEYTYDRKNRYQAKMQYANTINPTDLYWTNPPTPGLLPGTVKLTKYLLPKIKNPNEDRTSYEFFDTSGYLRYQVDAEQYITEIKYDSLSQPIAKIIYKEKLSDQNLQLLKNAGTLSLNFDPKLDSYTRTFYDNDGLVIAEQDPAGFITEYKRNSAGWITETIVYANPIPIDLNIESFTAVQPTISNDDAHTYAFYDGRGKCIIEINAKGYVTSNEYLSCGLLKQKRLFAIPVDADWFTAPNVPPKLPDITPEDQVVAYQYDLLNREILSVNSLDKSTATIYNKMDLIQAKKIQDIQQLPTINGDTYHGQENCFDGWKQLIKEANTFVAEKLALIDQDPQLNPAQKQAAREAIWQQYSTRHLYDGNGLHLKTITSIASETQFNNHEINDAVTIYYYDDERRPVITISPLGSVTEKTYNNFGEEITLRNYINRVPLASFDNLTGGYLSAHDGVRQLIDGLKNSSDPITKLQRNKQGLVEEIADPEGYKTIKRYDAFKQCETEILPVDSKDPSLTITHKFDTRRFEVETSKKVGDLISTVKRCFDNPYGKETERTNELGGTTKKHYDKLGFVRQTINPNGVTTCTYIRDAFNRVVTEINSFNEITQHSYNQADRTHTITTPLTGFTVTTQTNVFGETTKITDGLNNSETFQHAPDGQVSVHTDALQNKTEDRYNLQGWHSEHDGVDYKTTFKQDSEGHLIQQVEDSEQLKLTSQYERNSLGQAINVTDPRQVKTEQQFDKRGKIIKTSKVVSEKTVIQEIAYNGQGDKISHQRGDTAEPNQSLHTFQHDGLNHATGKTIDPTGLNIQTQQHLNEAGQVIASIDPNGNVIRTFYNNLGQKRFLITPIESTKATLKEWNYDNEGRVHCERTYVKGIDPSTINEKTSYKIIEEYAKTIVDNFDTQTWFFYDVNNKERFTINVLAIKAANEFVLKGIVTEKRYDKAAREIQTYQYANNIDANDLAKLTTKQLAELMVTKQDPAADRLTYKILDGNSQERFLIDPKGAVIEQRFNKSGKVISKVCYANMLSTEEAAEVAKLSSDAILHWLMQHNKIDPAYDRTTYFIFDSIERPEFTVDAEGGVVRFKHDANGNLTEECHFKTPFNPLPVSYEILVTQVKQNYSNTPDINIDRVTRHEYDGNNQLIKTIDAKGKADIFERDALGNIIKHTDRNNTVWQYTIDKAERITDEISPATDITVVDKQENEKLVPKKLNAQIIVKHNEYDKASNKIAVTEAANLTKEQQRKINFDYTANNQLQTAKIPDVVLDKFHKEKQELTVKVLYDNKYRKVAEQNENQQWTFKVYDTLDRPLYQINAEGAVVKTERNAFGETIKEIRFANKLVLGLLPYTTNGIPQTVVENTLVTNSQEDRVIEYLRDKQGNVEILKQSSILHYHVGKIISAQPEARKIYNAFKDCIYSAQLITLENHTKLWAEEYTWFNRLGKKLAECNANKYVKRYTLNTFGETEKCLEWATKLAVELHPQTTLAQIDSAYQPSSKDRTTTYEYDVLGLKIKETKVNVVFQLFKIKEENDKKITYLENQPAQDLIRTFQYNALQQPITTTYEDGSTEYKYYDARGYKIAETGIAFDNNGQTATLIPLTYYGINPHGQVATTTRFKTGTAKSDGKELPTPIAVDPDNDQTQVKLFDVRGLVLTQQDAMGYQSNYIYTPTRKVAREYWQLTNWVQDSQDKTKFTTITHLDEKRFEFDKVERPTAMKIYRDNNLFEETYSAYNAFGDTISEGSQQDPTTHELRRKFDRLGNIWFTNAGQGINTITLRDLAGRETLQLQSPTKDLAKTEYNNIPELLTLSIDEIERTETERDLVGNTIKKSLPAAEVEDPNQPQPVPLNMLVSHPSKTTTTISWTLPQERNVEMQFWLWQKASVTPLKIHKPIIIENGRCSVDVTDLVADVYDYKWLC